MKKIVLLIVLYVLAFPILATVSDCEKQGYVFQQQMLLLNTVSVKKPVLHIYLLHNLSKQLIWLDHPVKNRSASAGWASPLNPDRWSALLIASHNKNFALSCTQLNSGHTHVLNCRKVLDVCQLQHAVVGADVNSSYWLTENQLQQDLIPAIKRRN